MNKQEVIPLGVVLERRRTDHPWQDFSWKPVAVIPGAAPLNPSDPWKRLRSGQDWVQFHSGTLPLELYRRETEGYKVNLSQEPPRVFIVLRDDEEHEEGHEYQPFLVTACPYEAQDYLDSGEELVETVTMPPDVVAFVKRYIDQHHVDEPFYKRKRKRHDVDGGHRGPKGPRRDGAN